MIFLIIFIYFNRKYIFNIKKNNNFIIYNRNILDIYNIYNNDTNEKENSNQNFYNLYSKTYSNKNLINDCSNKFSSSKKYSETNINVNKIIKLQRDENNKGINDLLKLLNVNNFDEGFVKLNNLKKIETDYMQMIGMFNKFREIEWETEENNFLTWLTLINEKNKKNVKYSNFCKDIMIRNNINDFDGFKYFIDRLLIEKEKEIFNKKVIKNKNNVYIKKYGIRNNKEYEINEDDLQPKGYSYYSNPKNDNQLIYYGCNNNESDINI